MCKYNALVCVSSDGMRVIRAKLNISEGKYEEGRYIRSGVECRAERKICHCPEPLRTRDGRYQYPEISQLTDNRT